MVPSRDLITSGSMGSYLAALRALRGADHMSTEAARHCEAKSDRAAKVNVDFMMGCDE